MLVFRKVPNPDAPEPPRNEPDPKLQAARLKALGELAEGFDEAAMSAIARPNPGKPADALLYARELSHVEFVDGKDYEGADERFVSNAAAEGWATLGQGKIVFHTEPDEVVYAIVNPPGAYCCHCGDQLGGGNEIAQEHVAMAHPGEESPDAENPSGYKVVHFYGLERLYDAEPAPEPVS